MWQVIEFSDVGKLLRAARKKLDLSQEQFASALGVKLSRLQKWETGVNEPRFTIPELRRLRSLNREVFNALISGTLIQEAELVGLRLSRGEPGEGGAQKRPIKSPQGAPAT